MKPAGNIILLNQSTRWGSAIRRAGLTCRITWALDVDDLNREAAYRPGSVALVELTPANIVDTCQQLAQRINSPDGLLLIAAGNYRIMPWLPLVRGSGFSDCLLSTAEIARLGRIAGRHFSRMESLSIDPAGCSLENLIERELPWKPVRQRNRDQRQV